MYNSFKSHKIINSLQSYLHNYYHVLVIMEYSLIESIYYSCKINSINMNAINFSHSHTLTESIKKNSFTI